MSEADSVADNATKFGAAAPIFRVHDLEASIGYYVNILGFQVDWRKSGVIASVSRDRCNIFLCEGDQGSAPTWAWIGVGDVERLFAEYQTKGARIRHPPTNYDWACEMQVEDLDGHVLRLGSDAKPNQPLGEWLDMRGQRWLKSPTGDWTLVD